MIKICGLQSLGEVMLAAELGADAVGFVVDKGSPRCIRFEDACSIASKMHSSLSTVLVLRQWMDVPPELLPQWPGQIQVYEAFGGANRRRIFGCTVDELNQFHLNPNANISALLVDAQSPGTGKAWNWSSPRSAWTHSLPLILAGGLTPDNVADAIRQARPWAVDVSSGVESSRGVKDFIKVKDFIENAKGVEKENCHQLRVASTFTFEQL